MTLFHKIYIKFYYRFLNFIFIKREISVSNDNDNDKKHLFIYFDYEREYSGYETDITDSNIEQILQKLEKYNIITTWFVVGKIFKKYPESIQKIIKYNHELGSHTYSHIAPFQNRIKVLEEDIQMFKKMAPKDHLVLGFHPPNGQWTFKMFKLLKQNGFRYDVVGRKKNHKNFSHYLRYPIDQKFLRFVTLGDDWPIFNKEYSQEQVFDYFVSLSEKIAPGKIGGIGFHPWVLFSDPRIFKAFELFLEYLNNNHNTQIETIENYIKQLKLSDQKRND